MNLRQLARIDLNLLVTLQVLLEERSVSRAATRLHLTQPAISKALTRLRGLLEDPLFQRASKGLVPTPYALSLVQPLQEWLQGATRLLEGNDFDPATWQGEFAIDTNEFLQLLVLPSLVAKLAQQAPGIVLKMHTQFHDQLHGLEQGELDFVLNLEFSQLPPGFVAEEVYSDEPALFARAAHPLFSKKFKHDDIYRYPRLSVHMADMERFMLFQPRVGLPSLQQVWPVACETDTLSAALEIVTRTDYILPGPGLLARLASPSLHFKRLPPIGAPNVQLTYCLVSHQRVQHSPAHIWLRKTLLELLRTLVLPTRVAKARKP
jgi:DNA-binding transcriptional LysR family regulator